MSTRSQAVAVQFEPAIAAAMAAIDACSDAQRRATSRDEGWPVGFLAWHIGDAHVPVMDLVTAVAAGQDPPPLTAAMPDGSNAQQLRPARRRDHGLRGEGFGRLDVTVGERRIARANQQDCADGVIARLPYARRFWPVVYVVRIQRGSAGIVCPRPSATTLRLADPVQHARQRRGSVSFHTWRDVAVAAERDPDVARNQTAAGNTRVDARLRH